MIVFLLANVFFFFFVVFFEKRKLTVHFQFETEEETLSLFHLNFELDEIRTFESSVGGWPMSENADLADI